MKSYRLDNRRNSTIDSAHSAKAKRDWISRKAYGQRAWNKTEACVEAREEEVNGVFYLLSTDH